MIDYFSYLRLCGLKDTQATFIDYLIEVAGYTYEKAQEYSNIFYK